MNIYSQMNTIIEYIEEHLLEKISLEELSKVTGLNTTIIKTIFPCLVGCGIKEYIRNRKLTICINDLKNKDKVIDVAYKYGYNSSQAFIRAFKKFHGISPKNIKKDKVSLTLYHRIKFNEKSIENNIQFQIIYNKKIILYGISKEFSSKEITENISKFWAEIKKKYPIFLENKRRYGFIVKKDNQICKYYCCIDTPYHHFEKLEFKESDYLVLKIKSFVAKDISENIKRVRNKYLKSINLTAKKNFTLEVYHEDYIELLTPIN